MIEIGYAQKIYALLIKAYPHANIALTNWKSPWELLVAVILSAQCTDVRVNDVTKVLFTTYRTLEDYVNTDVSSFEQDIRSTGFYHNKAKNIIAAAKMVRDTFHGEVPHTMEEMLTLPGVARKTANVVLGNAFGIVEGIAVDTHVLRLSQRLRMVDLATVGGKKIFDFKKNGKHVVDYKKDADPARIEQQLMRSTPREQWFCLTYLLIHHGRVVCKAKKPACGACVLSTICPVSRV